MLIEIWIMKKMCDTRPGFHIVTSHSQIVQSDTHRICTGRQKYLGFLTFTYSNGGTKWRFVYAVYSALAIEITWPCY
jgi:hypothetical protein